MAKKKSLIIAIISVVVALAIASGVVLSIFVFGDNDEPKKKKPASNKKPSSSQQDNNQEEESDGVIWDDETMTEPVSDNLEDMLEDMENNDDDDFLDFETPIMGVPDVEDENDYDDSEPDGKDILTPIFKDNFEGYSELSVGDAVPGYQTYYGGQEISCVLDDSTSRTGNYSLKVNYTSTSVGWTGLSIPLDKENWYHHDYMSLWVKGDGAPQVMVIGVDSHRKYFVITDKEWQYIKLTWEDLGIENNKGVLVGVTQIAIALGSETNRTFWLDDINILKNTDSDPGKTSLLCEKYEDGFDKSAYYADENGGAIEINSDSSTKVNGLNSGKITYNTQDKGYSALNIDLGTQVWAEQNYLTFNVKGDGAEQKLKFGFTVAGKNNFETEITVNSSDWALKRIKLADFTGSGEKNLGNITDFYIRLEATTGDRTIWLDDLLVEYYIVPAVNADKFLTMEPNTDGLPSTWVPSAAYNTEVTAELSSSEHYEGSYSAKINIPEDDGSNFCAFNFEFNNPIDVSEFGKKFTIYMKGDTKYSTQQIRFTIKTADGVLSTGLINITSNGTWQPVVMDGGVENALSDAGAKRVTGLELLFATYGSARTVYIDSIEASKSEWVPIIDETLLDENEIAPPAWGADWAANVVNFDTPLDLSGSNGKLVFTMNTNITSSVICRLIIYTENKTSNIWATDSWYVDISGQQIYTILLEDLGLTDDDLKAITGYRLEAAAYSSPVTISYKVQAPRPVVIPETVKTDTLCTNQVLNPPAWGAEWAYADVTFDTPLDMSGSAGVIKLSQISNVVGDITFKLTLKLGDKDSSQYYYTYKAYNTPNSLQEISIPLSELGITDNDLKMVVGYRFQVAQNSNPATYIYSITAPAVPETQASEALALELTLNPPAWGAEWAYYNVSYDIPLDMSGSGGVIKVTQSSNQSGNITFKFTITTLTKVSSTYTYSYTAYNTPNQEQIISIPLEAIGLTDADLGCVTEFHFQAAQDSTPSDYKVSVTIPKLEEKTAAYATTKPVIDGVIDSVWSASPATYTPFEMNENFAHGYFKALWTEDTLYLMAVVYDATVAGIPDNSSTNLVNFWVSETASSATQYGTIPGDWYLPVNHAGNAYHYAGGFGEYMGTKAEYASKINPALGTGGGYIVEVAIPVQTENFAYTEGSNIGLGISIDDDTNGDNVRDSYCASMNPSNSYWTNPSVLECFKLVK